MEYGEYTKIITLPIGTKFWVINGEWHGEVIEEDGVKKIYMQAVDRSRVIKGDDELVVEILDDKEDKYIDDGMPY